MTSLAVLASAPLLIASGDIGRFRAPLSPDGLLGVGSTQTLPPLSFNLSLTMGYNYDPLVWRYSDGTFEPVIEHQLVMEAVGIVGIIPFIDVAVGVPVLLYQTGPTPGVEDSLDPYALDLGNLQGSGFGDIRVMPRIQVADERTYGIGAAVVLELTFDTNAPKGSNFRFFGDNGAAFRPRVIASLPLPVGRLIGSLGLRFRLGGATPVVPICGEAAESISGTATCDTGFDHELEYHLGGEIYLLKDEIPLSVLAELSGAISGGFGGAGQFPLELLVGARARLASDLLVTAGFGLGLTSGIGTPVLRAILGVAWAPRAEDQDLDGIPDATDPCPYVAEDRDGFEDDDGCPDPDNDEDGILDSDDECPNRSEDFNDLDDEDGCPDEHEIDSDDDGIPDVNDKCPNDPEDEDNFKDEDGCPDVDNDIDGIPDEDDECPTEQETINGVDDYDGCPDEGEALTEYVETKIDIKETILFESGKAIIIEDSKRILDQVALQILAHPDISMVRIEGHTDSQGPEEDNLFLSQDRSDSVRRYLIGRGVSKDKLQAIGYGETVPIDTNDTAVGRARNRRVDFVIIQEK